MQASSTASAAGHRISPLAICVGASATLLAGAIVTVPFWMVFKKAGAHPALSILMLIPLLNIAAIYWVAFCESTSGGPRV
jgi:predicted signal transduction protein with EAL and GGDEF domain